MSILFFILKLVCFLGILIYLIWKFNPSKKTYFTFVVLLISFEVFVTLSYIYQWGTYKEGQIDALNGKINYELKCQEDNSIEWVKIDNYEK